MFFPAPPPAFLPGRLAGFARRRAGGLAPEPWFGGPSVRMDAIFIGVKGRRKISKQKEEKEGGGGGVKRESRGGGSSLMLAAASRPSMRHSTRIVPILVFVGYASVSLFLSLRGLDGYHAINLPSCFPRLDSFRPRSVVMFGGSHLFVSGTLQKTHLAKSRASLQHMYLS